MNMILKMLLAALVSALVSTSAAAQCSGQFPNNTFCGYTGGGSKGLPGPVVINPGSLNPIAGGTVLGNPTTISAVPQATTHPILGVPGTSLGQIGFAGSTSGTATVQPQAVAGTPTLLLPTGSGTLPSSASAPLSLDTVTGALSLPGAAGQVLAGSTPAFTATPTLGVAGSSAGSVTFTNTTSGTVTLQSVTGALGTRTILLPAASGTAAVSSSAPLALNASTGNLTITGAAGQVLAGAGPAFTATPTLGVSGSAIGTLTFAGNTSGSVLLTPQAAAGSVTLTLPNTSGTVPSTASTPLVLSATTGALTCPTCVTSSGGGSITGVAPVAVSGAGAVSITGAAGQVLAGAGPAFTATPTLGVSGSSLGSLTLAGNTSGSVLVRPQATAGTVTLTLPNTSGTVAANATAPLSLSATTGTLTITGAAGQVLAGASPAFTATPTLGVAGSTAGTLTLAGLTSGSATVSVAAAAGTTTFQLPVGNGTADYPLKTNGSGVTRWEGPALTSSTGTLTIANGKTLTQSNTLTYSGTDGSSVAFGTGGTVAYAVATGTAALGTSAITSGTCATVVTAAATGVATTDVVDASFNGDPTAVTGYTPGAMLSIVAYPTANNVNFKVCNNTASSITPGAITLNWKVRR